MGVFALLSVFEVLFLTISSLGLTTSAIRMVPELQQNGQISTISDILKIAIILPSLIGLFVLIAGIIFCRALSILFLKSPAFNNLIILILINCFFHSIVDRVILLQSSLQRFKHVAVLSIIYHVSQRLLSLMLLFAYRRNVESIFIGFMISRSFITILALFSMKDYIFSIYNGYSIRKLVRFSWAYYGNNWARFAFNQADQAIVSMLFVPEILASYYIAKKTTSLVSLVWEALLEPVIPKMAETKGRGIEYFQFNLDKIMRAFTTILIMGTVIIPLNSKLLLLILGGREYVTSYTLVSIMAIAVLTNGLFSLYTIKLYLWDPPLKILKLYIIVGIINIIAGLMLGKYFSVQGFACAQSLGFIVGVILITLNDRQEWKNLARVYSLDLSIVLLALLIGLYLNRFFNFPLSGINKLWIIIINILFILLAVSPRVKAILIAMFKTR
jgi:O-antigen/teichoic acid export membrane protein